MDDGLLKSQKVQGFCLCISPVNIPLKYSRGERSRNPHGNHIKLCLQTFHPSGVSSELKVL